METITVQIPIEQYESLKKERDDYYSVIRGRKNISFKYHGTTTWYFVDESNASIIKDCDEKIAEMELRVKEKEKIIDSLVIENARLKQRKKRWLW